MSAFVLVAGKPTTRPFELAAFRYATVVSALPLRQTYFGGPMEVWEFPTYADAQYQADRLASGFFWAVTYKTLLGVQNRLAAIVQNDEG